MAYSCFVRNKTSIYIYNIFNWYLNVHLIQIKFLTLWIIKYFDWKSTLTFIIFSTLFYFFDDGVHVGRSSYRMTRHYYSEEILQVLVKRSIVGQHQLSG